MRTTRSLFLGRANVLIRLRRVRRVGVVGVDLQQVLVHVVLLYIAAGVRHFRISRAVFDVVSVP